MDVAFDDPECAAVINSALKMRARWGEAWQTVARRMFQMDACTSPDDVALLTDAQITVKRGNHVFEFPDGITVTARCRPDPPASSPVSVWSAVVLSVEWEQP